MDRNKSRIKRHQSLRKKIWGTKERPRLVVFRSLKHLYASLINDKKNETILSVSDFNIKKTDKKIPGKDIPLLIGETLAKKALEKKISQVVFDRSGYRYHGKIKALAETARQAGLKF